MSKSISVFFLILSLVFVSPVSAQESQTQPVKTLTAQLMAIQQREPMPALPKGPLYLTGTTPEQLTPQYWVNRLPDAEKIIKTPEELAALNEEVNMQLPEVMDIFKIKGMFRGADIQKAVSDSYQTIASRKLFDVTDKYIPEGFFENEVKPLLNLDKIPKMVNIRWGAATQATSVRALPTFVKMLEEKGDVEFDQLQFTLIKLWTPVAIYHTSTDGKWYFVQAPYVRGWVESKDISIFENEEELKKYSRSETYLVVTGESVTIYSDAERQNKIYQPTMGTVIPRAGKTNGSYMIYMPVRSSDGKVNLTKAYINSNSDVREQFPAFTQANVIRQAFKLLGARYGWGGQYNGRDCSGFTHDVFLSMGVNMPRDSEQQPFVGTVLGSYKPYEHDQEKKDALEVATEGITLLRMSNHIMLYLGKVDDKYFVIHSTWAERTGQDPVKDEKRRINQVVVSDLSLNGNSYIGGLFNRIIQISEVN